LRLPEGFVAGVEQRRGLGTIPGAGSFLFVSFSVFEVEHAAALAAVEDEATFHNFGFLSESYEVVRGFGCVSHTKRAANPVFASAPTNGHFPQLLLGFGPTGTFTGTKTRIFDLRAGL